MGEKSKSRPSIHPSTHPSGRRPSEFRGHQSFRGCSRRLCCLSQVVSSQGGGLFQQVFSTQEPKTRAAMGVAASPQHKSNKKLLGRGSSISSRSSQPTTLAKDTTSTADVNTAGTGTANADNAASFLQETSPSGKISKSRVLREQVERWSINAGGIISNSTRVDNMLLQDEGDRKLEKREQSEKRVWNPGHGDWIAPHFTGYEGRYIPNTNIRLRCTTGVRNAEILVIMTCINSVPSVCVYFPLCFLFL